MIDANSVVNQIANYQAQNYVFVVERLSGGIEVQLLNSAITGRLLAIPAVETVHVDQSAAPVRVWTVVDNPPEDVFDAIYDCERSIINQFDHERFDFHVVSRKGRSTRSFISLACPAWTK